MRSIEISRRKFLRITGETAGAFVLGLAANALSVPDALAVNKNSESGSISPEMSQAIRIARYLYDKAEPVLNKTDFNKPELQLEIVGQVISENAKDCTPRSYQAGGQSYLVAEVFEKDTGRKRLILHDLAGSTVQVLRPVLSASRSDIEFLDEAGKEQARLKEAFIRGELNLQAELEVSQAGEFRALRPGPVAPEQQNKLYAIDFSYGPQEPIGKLTLIQTDEKTGPLPAFF